VTDQNNTNQISDMHQQIANLRQQIDKADAETKKQIEKRDRLNEFSKKASQEIREIKQQRDEINEKVKLLKQQRDDIRVKTKPIMDQIAAINEKKQELKKKTPRVRQQDLQEELDAIEWKIQTTSLDLKEEKRLIGEVKQLELQLSSYKKIEKQNKKITELLNERKTFDAQADAFHQALSELAKQSQDLHVKMIAKIDEVKKSRSEADDQHKGYLQNKELIKQLLVENAVLTGQRMGLQNTIREQNKAVWEKESAERAKGRTQKEEERTRRMVDEKTLKEKLGAQAKDKLQRGEKLSWNEFQLLAGDDDSEESEAQN
jgi:uncharacterized coiled-coil DUF342 family protein